MPDEAKHMPPSQLARWIAIAALLLGAVALYFREAPRVPALGPASATADTTAPR